eukprot:6209468-Pleurochrysis_carterae.AAC.1
MCSSSHTHGQPYNRPLGLCAVRGSYGGLEQWRLLCKSASFVGLDGRFAGPWDTTTAVDITGSQLSAEAKPSSTNAMKAVPDSARVAPLRRSSQLVLFKSACLMYGHGHERYLAVPHVHRSVAVQLFREGESKSPPTSTCTIQSICELSNVPFRCTEYCSLVSYPSYSSQLQSFGITLLPCTCCVLTWCLQAESSYRLALLAHVYSKVCGVVIYNACVFFWNIVLMRSEMLYESLVPRDLNLTETLLYYLSILMHLASSPVLGRRAWSMTSCG